MNAGARLDVPQAPSSTDAERAVLGALLIDPSTVARVSTFLRPEHFFLERHGAIFRGLLAVHEQLGAVDFLLLVDHLERKNQLADVGGASYLVELTNEVPTAAHVVHYAREIERSAVHRGLIRVGGEVARLGFQQPDDLDEAITTAEAKLYQLREGRNTGRLVTPMERASRALDRHSLCQQGVRPGLSYGFRDLDAVTRGAHPGQLIVAAGRPSMGKTSLMQSMAQNMARAGGKVMFCSAEMTEADLTDREVAALVGKSVHALQGGEYGDDVMEAISSFLGNTIAEELLYIVDDPDMTTVSIRAIATEMRSKYGLDAIFVDYLQILHDTYGRSDNERVSYISRQLKALARALGVPVIAGSQLNRGCEDRRSKRPQLSDLRDSGAVEQDADVVLLLYRGNYYWPTKDEWAKEWGKEPWPGNLTELIVAKQRQGKRGGFVRLYFDATSITFRDAEVQHAGPDL